MGKKLRTNRNINSENSFMNYGTLLSHSRSQGDNWYLFTQIERIGISMPRLGTMGHGNHGYGHHSVKTKTHFPNVSNPSAI